MSKVALAPWHSDASDVLGVPMEPGILLISFSCIKKFYQGSAHDNRYTEDVYNHENLEVIA